MTRLPKYVSVYAETIEVFATWFRILSLETSSIGDDDDDQKQDMPPPLRVSMSRDARGGWSKGTHPPTNQTAKARKKKQRETEGSSLGFLGLAAGRREGGSFF